MDQARAVRGAKLAEADALLGGLDGFLLAALGLTPPPTDDRKVFAATLRKPYGNFTSTPTIFTPSVSLRSEQWTRLRSASHITSWWKSSRLSETKSKRPDGTTSAWRMCKATRANWERRRRSRWCLLPISNWRCPLARLRPYLNKVYRAEMDGCCSPEFHVLRVDNAQELLPDYLAAILRSNLTLAQTRHMMTGNTHPRLTNEMYQPHNPNS